MSYCYLAFRTNVLLNLCCPGHLSYCSPNESEPLPLLSKIKSTSWMDLPRQAIRAVILRQMYINCAMSLFTDTGPTSPSSDPIKPGVWIPILDITGVTRRGVIP